MDELASNGVNIYRFPVDDETVSEMNNGMNVSEFNKLPLLVFVSWGSFAVTFCFFLMQNATQQYTRSHRIAKLNIFQQ